MYQEVNSFGNSFKHLRALIELGCPHGTAFPAVAPFPARFSFFILEGVDPVDDKLYLSDGAGGFNLVGEGSGGGSTSGIQSLLAGNNVVIDNSDPKNPVISAVFSQAGKYLISGGAAWSGSGFIYDVSQINYFWNGIKSASPTQVTLDASDATHNRLDALVVNEAGVISVITGDPSANPITPAIPDTELLIQYILVVAASTEPSVTKENIYLENVEWATSNYTTSGTQAGNSNFAATDSPKQGTVCIDNLLDGRTGVRFVKSTVIDISVYNSFLCWVRFNAVIANQKNLYVRFEDASGVLIGSQVDLFDYGISRSVLNTWQLATVPVADFGGISSVKGLKMILAGGTDGILAEWDLDNIVLSTGSVAPTKDPVISFLKNGTLIGAQSKLNIIEGSGIGITAVEDPITGMVSYTINANGTASPDATTTVKGIVKLAGDLAGTADNPTVPALGSLQSQITTLDSTKLNAADYNDRFKGKYPTLSALQAAHPTANAGDYAQVDTGAGSNVINYNWDTQDGWVIGSSVGPTLSTTDDLAEGSTNLYFTTARAIAAVDISGKVDKVAGKQLSTEDYTTDEKTKLAGIEEGAQKNDANTTLQGNTFNGVSQLVKTDAEGKLPALDGSKLTNLPGGGGDVTKVYVDAADANLQSQINNIPSVGNKLFNYFNF